MDERTERQIAAANAAAACMALTKRDVEEAEKNWKRIPFLDLIDAFGIIEPKEDPVTHFHMRILWQWQREGYVPPIREETLRRHGLPGAFGRYRVSSHSAFSAYTLKRDILSEDWFDLWVKRGEGATLGRAIGSATIDSLEALGSYYVLVPPLSEQERITKNLERWKAWKDADAITWWIPGLIDFPETDNELYLRKLEEEWELEDEEIMREAELEAERQREAAAKEGNAEAPDEARSEGGEGHEGE